MKDNARGLKYLIGIDEVGRGPLAGPVAVGAFSIQTKNLAKARKLFRGVKESKQLSEAKREEWFVQINKARLEGLIDFAVSFESGKVIDGRGISFSIKRAMLKSLNKVCDEPCASLVLLDGGLKAPAEFTHQKTIIKGDEKEMVIALASICAKVLRDRRMRALVKKYPKYGFDVNKGYGTSKHLIQIRKTGLINIHRVTFCKNLAKNAPLR